MPVWLQQHSQAAHQGDSSSSTCAVWQGCWLPVSPSLQLPALVAAFLLELASMRMLSAGTCKRRHAAGLSLHPPQGQCVLGSRCR